MLSLARPRFIMQSLACTAYPQHSSTVRAHLELRSRCMQEPQTSYIWRRSRCFEKKKRDLPENVLFDLRQQEPAHLEPHTIEHLETFPDRLICDSKIFIKK